MKNFSYENLISRNYSYVSEETQEKIKKTNLLFLGTGLSSNIIINCTRIGFCNFVLYDGDRIELTNLNRQQFYMNEIGSYKVDVLKKRIKSINPNSKVRVTTNYISSIDDIKEGITQSDIIINTVDCNKLYFDIIECGMKYKKLVVCPFNPGYDGFVLFFNQNSALPQKVFNLDIPLDDIQISRQIFEKYPMLKTLDQANVGLNGFLENARNYFPQIIVGAELTTALSIIGMIKNINGESIPLAPDPFFVNLY